MQKSSIYKGHIQRIKVRVLSLLAAVFLFVSAVSCDQFSLLPKPERNYTHEATGGILVDDDFEVCDETFSCLNGWKLGGSSQPVIQNDQTYYGKNSVYLKPGNEMDPNYFSVNTSFPQGATVSFAVKSSKSYYSGESLVFMIGDTPKGIPANDSWQVFFFQIPPGDTILKWQATKESVFSNATVQFYIDSIQVVPGSQQLIQYEDFEIGENNKLINNHWSWGEDTPPVIQSVEKRSGNNALELKCESYKPVSHVQIKFSQPAPVILSFWAKRSGYFGNAAVYLDNQKKLEVKSSWWREYIIEIPAGDHTIKWEFLEKSSSRESLFIDDIKIFTPFSAMTPDMAGLTWDNKVLDWEDVPGAEGYQVQISSDENFTTLLVDNRALTISKYTLTETYRSNTRYFWRVRAKKNGNWQEYFSEPTSFVIDPLLVSDSFENSQNLSSGSNPFWFTGDVAPVLYSPFYSTERYDGEKMIEFRALGLNNQSILKSSFFTPYPAKITFAVEGNSYSIFDFAFFINTIRSATFSSKRWQRYSFDLNPGLHNFSWVFKQTGENSGYMDIDGYMDDVKVSYLPLVQTAAQIMNNSTTPLLEWEDINNTSCYQFQISPNADFSVITEESSNHPSSRYQINSPLDANKSYFWRIKPQNAITGEWYPYWSPANLLLLTSTFTAESFESTNSRGLPTQNGWYFGGNRKPEVQSDVFRNGSKSIKIKGALQDEIGYIATAVDLNESKTLSFWLKSDLSSMTLKVYIDDNPASISVSQDYSSWTEFTATVPAGSHYIKWQLESTYTGSYPTNYYVFIDDITLE